MISPAAEYLLLVHFHLLVQIFLFLNIPNFIFATTKFEWILLKYELPSLPFSFDNLQFRIYVCSNPVMNPAANSNKCKSGSVLLQMKSAPKKRTFSNICLIESDDNGKCKAIKIQLNCPTEANFVYLRVDYGHSALLNPQYQQLPHNGRRKNILRLMSTNKPGKFLSIAYSIQMPIEKEKGGNSKSTSTKATTISPLKRIIKKEKRKKVDKSKNTLKIGAAPIQHALQPSPKAISTIPTTICELIAQMGQNEFQIRQFLMADAGKQKINPMKFDVEYYKMAVIKIHNRYRQLHGSGELSHDWECENSAKNWAETVACKADCLSHEPQKRFGESLFFYSTLEPELTDPDTLAEATVRTFYVEGRDYRQSGGSSNWNAIRHGHFTQLLWRQTRRIGVGVSIVAQPTGTGQCMPSRSRQKQAWLFYVVLRYDPPGNIRCGSEDSFDGNVTVGTGNEQNCMAL